MAVNTTLAEFLKGRPQVNPTIYAYALPGVKSHEGYIKIGYTDRDVQTRIAEQLHTSGLKPQILFAESAMRADGSCFTDRDVHAILRRRGIRQLDVGEGRNEWFKCDISHLRSAMLELKEGITTKDNRSFAFKMRPEQHYAVERTMEYFASAKAQESGRAPKFLWNAKMRFGKTFAAYQLAKKMGLKRVLVLTFKPAVESAWRDDLMTHVDFEGWQFVSNKDAHKRAIKKISPRNPLRNQGIFAF